MRGNLIVIAVLLAIGIVVLRLVRPAAGDAAPRRGLVVAAFLCGPISALAYFMADVLWISPDDYLVVQDYFDSVSPLLLIGLFGGALGAAVLWLTEYLGSPRRRSTPP